MTAQKNNSRDCFQGEQVLFSIRGSVKKRTVTAAIFILFILVSLAGAFVLKSIYISLLGVSALILSFWPLTDAYVRIEVTDKRIKYSKFSKITAKTEDVPLNRLASCAESKDKSKIVLLYLSDDSKTPQSVRCLQFNMADENATLLTQLPCPKQEDLEQIHALNYR